MSGARGGSGRLSQPPVSSPAKSPRRPAPGAGRAAPGVRLPALPAAPWGPAVAPSRGLRAPSRRPVAAHTLLPLVPHRLGVPSSLPPPRGRSNFWTCLAARGVSLRAVAGAFRGTADRVAPAPPPGPPALAPGRLPLAPLPSPPDIPESSRRASARWSLLPLPSLWGARGAGCESRSQGGFLYSFNSFPFPFLLCVTFTYLLIRNRSGLSLPSVPRPPPPRLRGPPDTRRLMALSLPD